MVHISVELDEGKARIVTTISKIEKICHSLLSVKKSLTRYLHRNNYAKPNKKENKIADPVFNCKNNWIVSHFTAGCNHPDAANPK